MKLPTKLLLITDSKGAETNVESRDIILSLNGQPIETRLADVFSDLEFDDGEIYGNSLLSYYQVNEDGSLEVEGSKIQFIDASNNEPILVKMIKRPGIHNDTDIPFEHVQKFVEYFKVAKPDEVFTNLSDDEKQAFISERQSRQSSESEAASSAAAAKAETHRLEKEAERTTKEAELKASIDPAYVQDMNGYISTQRFYAGLEGFKEYTKDQYHLFYGDDAEQAPCLLIKRGEAWWEECPEVNTEIIEKTEKVVVIQFNDGKTIKKVTLDIKAGTITILDSGTE